MLKLIGRALALLGALVLLVSATPVPLDRWARALAGNWNDPRGDVLIVLGGDVQSDGTIGLHSYWRTVYAARVWRETGFRRIVISGAAVGREMKKFLVAEGVPESAIDTEPRSTNTRENALFTKEMLAGERGRLVLLTSEYHIYRALRVFQKAGLAVEPRPIPDVLKSTSNWKGRWPAFLELATETVKIGYYRLRGWL